jgi:hypothetical protein
MVDRLDREWCPLRIAAKEADIDALIQRELDMDRDAWLLEVEDRSGRHFLDDWLAKE